MLLAIARTIAVPLTTVCLLLPDLTRTGPSTRPTSHNNMIGMSIFAIDILAHETYCVKLPVDREAAPASSGMRMRQRGWQSETRALTLGSILSGQTRSQARSAGNSRTRPRSVSSVQRKKGDFRFSMAPPVRLGTSRCQE
jgi:hypothetical protein